MADEDKIQTTPENQTQETANVIPEAVQKALDDQNEILKAQNEKIATLVSENATLKATALKTAAADKKDEKPTIPTEPVTVAKKKYKFTVASFRLGGYTEPIKSSDASLDEDILKKILDIKGQGILVEVK